MIYWSGDNLKNKTEFLEQYDHFYVKSIIPVMKESGVNISQNFMDTSPSNGVKSFEPYVKFSDFSTSDQNYGDSHYYYLMLDCEADETHR